MKPHVLTTMTSAAEASLVCAYPLSVATPSMTSLSTRFLGQPRLTKWMVLGFIEADGRKTYGKPGFSANGPSGDGTPAAPTRGWSGPGRHVRSEAAAWSARYGCGRRRSLHDRIAATKRSKR